MEQGCLVGRRAQEAASCITPPAWLVCAGLTSTIRRALQATLLHRVHALSHFYPYPPQVQVQPAQLHASNSTVPPLQSASRVHTFPTPHRRFDFNLPRPMTPAEVSEVERLVNSWVAASTPTTTKVMDLAEAKAAGATAMFGEKYDDVVRVVDVPGVSMELCGGEEEGVGSVGRGVGRRGEVWGSVGGGESGAADVPGMSMQLWACGQREGGEVWEVWVRAG